MLMRLLRLGLSPRVSKHSRCGVFGVALKAPKPDENPSGMQGNQDEAIKTSQTT